MWPCARYPRCLQPAKHIIIVPLTRCLQPAKHTSQFLIRKTNTQIETTRRAVGKGAAKECMMLTRGALPFANVCLDLRTAGARAPVIVRVSRRHIRSYKNTQQSGTVSTTRLCRSTCMGWGPDRDARLKKTRKHVHGHSKACIHPVQSVNMCKYSNRHMCYTAPLPLPYLSPRTQPDLRRTYYRFVSSLAPEVMGRSPRNAPIGEQIAWQ